MSLSLCTVPATRKTTVMITYYVFYQTLCFLSLYNSTFRSLLTSIKKPQSPVNCGRHIAILVIDKTTAGQWNRPVVYHYYTHDTMNSASPESSYAFTVAGTIKCVPLPMSNCFLSTVKTAAPFITLTCKKSFVNVWLTSPSSFQ